MYKPKVGDVIRFNGKPVVVVDFKNYEKCVSCDYDRKYLLCDLEYLEKCQGCVPFSQIEAHSTLVVIRGGQFPHMEKIDTAPFEIKNVDCVMVRRKVPKTVIVYE